MAGICNLIDYFEINRVLPSTNCYSSAVGFKTEDDTKKAAPPQQPPKRPRSRLPLPRPVLRGAAVEVVVVLIGQVREQGVVLDGIRGEPSQGRLLRWLTRSHPFDLQDQSLIRWHVEWLIGDDSLAVKMRMDRHEGSLSATSSSMPATPGVHFTSKAGPSSSPGRSWRPSAQCPA